MEPLAKPRKKSCHQKWFFCAFLRSTFLVWPRHENEPFKNIASGQSNFGYFRAVQVHFLWVCILILNESLEGEGSLFNKCLRILSNPFLRKKAHQSLRVAAKYISNFLPPSILLVHYNPVAKNDDTFNFFICLVCERSFDESSRSKTLIQQSLVSNQSTIQAENNLLCQRFQHG